MRKRPPSDDFFRGSGPGGGAGREGEREGEDSESFDVFAFSDDVFGRGVDGEAGDAGAGEFAGALSEDELPLDDRMSIEDVFDLSRVRAPDLSGVILAGVAERGVFLDARGRRKLRRTRWTVCAGALAFVGAFTAAVCSFPELTVWAFRPAPLTQAARSAEKVADRTAMLASATREAGFDAAGPAVPTIMRLTGFDAAGLQGRVGGDGLLAAGVGGASSRRAGVGEVAVAAAGGVGGVGGADRAVGLRTGVFVAERTERVDTSVVDGSAVSVVVDDAAASGLAGSRRVVGPSRGVFDLRELAARLGGSEVLSVEQQRLLTMRGRFGGWGDGVGGGAGGVGGSLLTSGVPSVSGVAEVSEKVSAAGVVGGGGGVRPSRAAVNQAEPVSARGWFNRDEAGLPR